MKRDLKAFELILRELWTIVAYGKSAHACCGIFDKPHLDATRRERLAGYEKERADIVRLLE